VPAEVVGVLAAAESIKWTLNSWSVGWVEEKEGNLI
jgi:hypothetical protein